MTIANRSVEARLRARNQLTLPDAVVRAAGIREGERFLVEIAPDDPDTVRLHRIRTSYAGALAEVYGRASDALEDAREGWE